LDSAPRSPNGFLSSLTADDFELVRPHLRTADLTQELVLVEVDETLKRAYLPHRGVISLVVKLARGEHVQIAMVGRDSIFGAFAALGDPIALNSAVVLVPGVASTIDLDQLRAAADQSATFRTALARHGLAVYAQIQQTAGCNASHTVESRLARCLLHTRDLSGSDKLVLTQESMAQMIGARRNSVSLVANTLQQADFMISISEYTKQKAVEANVLDPERIYVLPNALEWTDSVPGPTSRQVTPFEGTRLLSVCRLEQAEQYKGVDKVIEVLPQVAQRVPDVKYIVVGGGTDLARHQELAERLGIMENRWRRHLDDWGL
jgi:CRP-like cAMP-binding protein